MLKRSAAIVLAVAFLSLAIAPETLAQQRGRRGGCDRTATSYSQSSYRGDDRSRYYAQPYSSGVAGTRYYSESNYRGTTGTRYYDNGGYYGDRYYGDRYNNHSTRNLVLSVAAPAAVGAGIGAIVDGGKGAGIGALIGGGGGALVYLLEHKGRRR
jgi:hypothetical protein